MRNPLVRTAAAVVILALPASASALEAFPVLDDDFKAEPTISALGGTQTSDVEGVGSGTVAGVELSLACPVFKVEGPGSVRQQLSVTRFDQDGLEQTHIEINPHYLVPLGPDFAIGFGPGLGYVSASPDGGDNDGVFGVQAGVSLHYRAGPLFLGAEYRYQWTQEADFGTAETELDNQRAVAKVGVNF
jgi:hypothetical protein